MADFIALFEGEEFTSTASTTITGGQLLMVTGSGTVGPTTGAVTSWVGVAAFDAVNLDKVTVLYDGIYNLTASGGITAGDQVISAAAGKVSTLAAASGSPAAGDVNAARQVCGVALTTATDGNPVTIRLAR